MKRNKFSKALKHLKSKKIDDKIKSLDEAVPTNSMGGVYQVTPSTGDAFRMGAGDPPRRFYPKADGTWPAGIPANAGDRYYDRVGGYYETGKGTVPADQNNTPRDLSLTYMNANGNDTSTMIRASDGAVYADLPEGTRNFILGPLITSYTQNHIGFGLDDDFTNLGYIQKDTRQFVLLGRIEGFLDGTKKANGIARTWDGTATQFTSYNSNFTLEHALWMQQRYNEGNFTANVPFNLSGGIPADRHPDDASKASGDMPGSNGGQAGGNSDNIGTPQDPADGRPGFGPGELRLWNLNYERSFPKPKRKQYRTYRTYRSALRNYERTKTVAQQSAMETPPEKDPFSPEFPPSPPDKFPVDPPSEPPAEPDPIPDPDPNYPGNYPDRGGKIHDPSGLDAHAKKVGYNDELYPLNPNRYYSHNIDLAQDILSSEMDYAFYSAAANGDSPNYNTASINKAKANLAKARKEADNWERWKQKTGYTWRGSIQDDALERQRKQDVLDKDKEIQNELEKLKQDKAEAEAQAEAHAAEARALIAKFGMDVAILLFGGAILGLAGKALGRLPAVAKFFKLSKAAQKARLQREIAKQTADDVIKAAGGVADDAVGTLSNAMQNVADDAIDNLYDIIQKTGSKEAKTLYQALDDAIDKGDDAVRAVLERIKNSKFKSQVPTGSSGIPKPKPPKPKSEFNKPQGSMGGGYDPGANYGSLAQSYELGGKVLSEEDRKRILREVRQPLREIQELPKTTKLKGYRPNFKGKFSPQNTPDVTASKESDDIVSAKNSSRQIWTAKDKFWKGYETTERMNIIYDNLGHGSQYFDRIVGENVRQKNKKSREVQEHLNMLAHQKAMREVYGIKEYENFIDESETYDNKINDPLFTKVAKRLKKEIDYPKKPAAKGYPDKPPAKIDPNTGMHPKFGKRYKYDKLDPISAKTMAGAPTGDPEIDANVKKAAKVKEDWRSDLKNLWLGSERKDWKNKIEEGMTTQMLTGILPSTGDADLENVPLGVSGGHAPVSYGSLLANSEADPNTIPDGTEYTALTNLEPMTSVVKGNENDWNATSHEAQYFYVVRTFDQATQTWQGHTNGGSGGSYSYLVPGFKDNTLRNVQLAGFHRNRAVDDNPPGGYHPVSTFGSNDEVGQPYTNSSNENSGVGVVLNFNGPGSPRFIALKPVDATQVDTIKVHALVSDTNLVRAGAHSSVDCRPQIYYWAGNHPDFKKSFLNGSIAKMSNNQNVTSDGWRPINMKPNGDIDPSVDPFFIKYREDEDASGNKNRAPGYQLSVSNSAAHNKVYPYSLKLPEWTNVKDARFMLIQHFDSSNSGSFFNVSGVRYQRKNNMKIPALTKPLTDIETSPFVRVGPTKKNEGGKERKKKVQNIIRSGLKYTGKKFSKDFPVRTDLE